MSHPHLTSLAAAGIAHSIPAPAGPSRQASQTLHPLNTRSSQFSRSTSTYGGSTLSVPNASTPHLTATHMPAPEREGLRSMLRGMVHAPKYAVFDVSVTIEALEQVPQTEGVFEARWKFNGKSPAGKEQSKLSHKSSMPEMRSPASATQSTVSLRSSNTSLSSTSSPTASIHPPTKSLLSPLSMTSNSPPRVGKKASDPTPLRHSVKMEDKGDLVESPIDLASPATSLKDLPDEGGALRIQTGRSASQMMTLPDTSMRSFASNMGRRSSGVPPPIRSGTGPSPAVLLGVPPTQDQPGIMVRSPTGTSTSSATSEQRHSLDGPASASSQSSKHVLGLNRAKSRPEEPTESHHRKGVTEARRLRQHACSWSHTVHHTVKIPMGKPVSATPIHSGTATPNAGARKEMAPLLGGGQHSESGFRLIINEIRTVKSADAGHSYPIGAMGAHGIKEDVKDEVKHLAETVAHPKSAQSHRLVFGTVEFDLAQFAGRGKVNRRFLLRGSRTNAVVAVKVELVQVGGETHWAAPPLQEGHHVTTGDFTATVRPNDLALNRNSSNSSSGSGAESGTSNLNIPQMRARSPSDVSLNAPTKVGYRGYEHHLKPTDAPRSRSRRPRTPDSPRDSPGLDDRPMSPGSRRDSVLPFDRTKRFHRHHSIHLRNFASPSFERHSGHGVLDLAPELVIEGIFNPRQGFEEGPMTTGPDSFLPTPLDVPDINIDLDGEKEENGIISIGSPAQRPGAKKRVWTGLRRRKEKDKEGQWVIASLTGTAEDGVGPALQPLPSGYTDDGEVRNRRGGLDLDSRTQSASTIRAYHVGQGIAGQARTPVETA